MVRIEMTAYNPGIASGAIQPYKLDFSQLGDLTRPIQGSELYIRAFSIPSGGIPLIDDWSTFGAYINLCFGYSVDGNGDPQAIIQTGLQPVPFKNYLDEHVSGDNTIWSIDKLIFIINDALYNLNIDLQNRAILEGIALPTVYPPYIRYDRSSQLFTIYAPRNAYGLSTPPLNRMFIRISRPLYHILGRCAIDTKITQFNSSVSVVPYCVVFDDFDEDNVEVKTDTTYALCKQWTNSLAMYTTFRGIAVFSDMPVIPEIQASSTASSNESVARIIGIYFPDYSSGYNDFVSGLFYSAPTNNYRPTKITSSSGIYQIKCTFKYMRPDGSFRDITIPSHTSALVTLEIV
jgi:hypothetical protein